MKRRSRLSTMRRAAKLDLYDLNFLYSAETFRWIEVHPELRPKTVLYGIFKFLYKLLRSSQYRKRPKLEDGSVLAFVTSKNQHDALRPLANHLPKASVVGASIHGRYSALTEDPDEPERVIPYPLWHVYLYALPFFPLVCYHWLTARGYRRKTYRAVFDVYWATYGHYIVAARLLERLRPSAVLVSNDHLMWTRALVQAAQALGIPTVYVQHASVTENFPPLSFDYAFLDGRDALAKYEAAGPSTTQIFLTGMPKFDRYHAEINTSERVEAVGICTNRFDPADRVRALCSHLRTQDPDLRVVLRPHPGDKNPELWHDIAETYGLDLSDSKHEDAFAFLQRVDAILAGDSNILLEATLMNVVAVYYDFPKAQKDYYGFIETGLTTYTATPEEAAALLQTMRLHKPSVRDRARYYCATVDTAFDGRSAEVSAKLLRQILDEALEEELWHEAADTPLNAYVLKRLDHARHAA